MAITPLTPWTQAPDLIYHLGSFLSSAQLSSSVLVSKLWKQNLQSFLTANLREDDACRDLGYPNELIQAFRSRGFSLWRVPELPMNQTTGYLEQIGDSMEEQEICYRRVLRAEDVAFSVMRFTDSWQNTDIWEAPFNIGLAFRCVEKDPKGVKPLHTIVSLFIATNDSEISSIWTASSEIKALHSRYVQIYRPDHPPLHSLLNWRDTRVHGPADSIDWDQVLRTCSSCYVNELTRTAALIRGQNPVIKIDGDISQIHIPLPQRANAAAFP